MRLLLAQITIGFLIAFGLLVATGCRRMPFPPDDAGDASVVDASQPDADAGCEPPEDVDQTCERSADCSDDELVCNGIATCVCGACTLVDPCPDDGVNPGCEEAFRPIVAYCRECDRDQHCQDAALPYCHPTQYECVATRPDDLDAGQPD